MDFSPLRRFEAGLPVSATHLMRPRLDMAYGLGGYTCRVPVHLDSTGLYTEVRFPEYWVGPVCVTATQGAGTGAHRMREIRFKWGRWRADLLFPSGVSATMHRTSTNDEPLQIEQIPWSAFPESSIPWNVEVSLGYDPEAVDIPRDCWRGSLPILGCVGHFQRRRPCLPQIV